MKTLILDGSIGEDPTGTAVRAAVLGELHTRGANVQAVRVSEKHIGPCMGDFFCWTRTPGQCAQDDDNRAIAKAFARSDLVVFLTPVTFGGYSSELKRALDHLIQNISPFFAMVDGETHHQKRYDRYPRLLAVGWLPAPDEAAEATFRHLVGRNAINAYAPAAVSGVVHAGWEPSRVRREVAGWVDDVVRGVDAAGGLLPTRRPEPESGPSQGLDGPVRRALLLVGSPRGKKSTSQSLGGYLHDRLGEFGVHTEVIRLYTVQKSEERREALLRAVDEADLVTLAFPVYVDCLPAPVLSVLEWIFDHTRRAGQTSPKLFAALANCGFPEAAHNETALAICEGFARGAGFTWAGGLGLGGGQGLVGGVPLAELGRRGASIRRALDLTAEALAAGRRVPAQAVALMARPMVPPWLYRVIGGVSWRIHARKHGAQRRLRAQPYA